jgi:hypothetical protein
MQIKRILPYFSSLLAVFFLFLLTSSKVAHPFYVSMTEVKVDTLAKTVSVSCRMFTDDLQDALFKSHQLKKDIIPGDADVKEALSAYINKRFNVFVGNQEVSLKFIGFEIEEESTWAYLEGSFNKNSKKVTLKNSLLYDFIPGQNNMMHCYFQEVRKSNKLSNPKKEVVFEF